MSRRNQAARENTNSNDLFMKTTVKVGLMALVAGVLLVGSLPARANQPVDYWSVRGLTRPGAWFEKHETENPVTVAVSKSGEGIGQQKQTASKVGQKSNHKAGSASAVSHSFSIDENIRKADDYWVPLGRAQGQPYARGPR
jgi:hypothetical protein